MIVKFKIQQKWVCGTAEITENFDAKKVCEKMWKGMKVYLLRKHLSLSWRVTSLVGRHRSKFLTSPIITGCRLIDKRSSSRCNVSGDRRIGYRMPGEVALNGKTATQEEALHINAKTTLGEYRSQSRNSCLPPCLPMLSKFFLKLWIGYGQDTLLNSLPSTKLQTALTRRWIFSHVSRIDKPDTLLGLSLQTPSWYLQIVQPIHSFKWFSQ